MPRQRSSARAPSRPTVPARSAPAPTQQQQTRPATTYAPAGQQHSQQAMPQQAPVSQGPGMLGQIASTAAYVASPTPRETWSFSSLPGFRDGSVRPRRRREREVQRQEKQSR